MFRVKKIVCANEVYKKGLYGENIGIAVLDSGVYFEHPDIRGRVMYFKDFENKREYPYDDNGHGTHVAGIICGNGACSDGKITGMAPKANLYIFKVLDDRGNGSAQNALFALEWVKNNYKEYHIKLLNFSVGFLPGAGIKEQNELLQAVENLWDLGITIVCAAGNNGPGRQSVTVPGVSRKVITVGSYKEMIPKYKETISKYEERYVDIARYSGIGPTACCIVKPEVVAPGNDIVSLSNQMDGYVKKSGTSMSCPIVCGALALLYENNPKISPLEAKLKLYLTSKRKNINYQNKTWGLLCVDDLVLL